VVPGSLQQRRRWYLVRYSNDDGGTWRALAPRLRDTEFTVDLDRLPGGEACRLQVLATEGIRTGQAVTEAFRVPRRPREVVIAAPTGEVAAGEPVTLVGEAFSQHHGVASPSELRWSSDLDGDLGAGREVRGVLQPGLHEVTLRAPDGQGGEVTGSVRIQVQPRPSAKHTSRSHPGHSSTDHDAGA
jgi:hypothetical protein